MSNNAKLAYADGRPKRLQRILLALVVVLVAVGCYYNTLSAGFVNWDDPKLILKNPYVRGLTLENLKHIWTNPIKETYLPLRVTSYALDYEIWGYDARGYHLTNVILHAVVALLVFQVARRLSGSWAAGFFAGVLFAAHPVHTEAVAWASGRKDLLSTVLLLASFFMYLAARRGGRARWGLVAGSIVVFLLAGLAKAMVVTLPALVVLTDIIYRDDVGHGGWKRLVPVWAAYFAAAAVIAGIAVHFAGASGAIRPWHFGGKAPTALFMAWVAVYYVKTMVFPNFLSARYPYGDTADFGVPGWMLWISVLVLTAMVAGVVWLIITVRKSAKGHPPSWMGLFAFGMAWFFITLAPVMNFVSINVLVADRYLYLPSVGFLIAIAALLWFVWGARTRQVLGRASIGAPRWIAVVLCAGLVLADGARTYARNRVWHDSLSLWTSVVKEFPKSAEARLLLASAYAEIKPPQYEKALAEIDRAGKITPLAGKVHLARGKVLAAVGRQEDALAEFARARALGEADWQGQYEAYLCEAEALCKAGRPDAAEAPLKQAIALDPSRPEAFFALGDVLERRGHGDRAAEAYRQALSRDPKYADAWYNLGKIASQKGDFSAAAGYYNKALDADPSYAEAMVNLGVLYLRSGDALRAREILEEAVKLRPDLAAAHLNLARACGMTGDVARAAGELHRAIELDPDNAIAQELLKQIKQAQKGGE